MNDFEGASTHGSTGGAGPVAGAALKDRARWPGFLLIVVGLLVFALALAGLAAGRHTISIVALGAALIAVCAGASVLLVKQRRLREHLGEGTPERPEDVGPVV